MGWMGYAALVWRGSGLSVLTVVLGWMGAHLQRACV